MGPEEERIGHEGPARHPDGPAARGGGGVDRLLDRRRIVGLGIRFRAERGHVINPAALRAGQRRNQQRQSREDRVSLYAHRTASRFFPPQSRSGTWPRSASMTGLSHTGKPVSRVSPPSLFHDPDARS